MKKQANHSSFIYQFFIFRVPSSAPHITKQNPGTFDQYFSAHSVAIFQEQTGSDMYISRLFGIDYLIGYDIIYRKLGVNNWIMSLLVISFLLSSLLRGFSIYLMDGRAEPLPDVDFFPDIFQNGNEW